MTLRLIDLASRHWRTFDGWAASRNTDPIELSIDRFLNLVYFWATRNAEDENAIAKFDRRLWMPPKGVEPPPESPWSAQNETSAFQALKKALNAEGSAPGQAASTG